MQADWSPTARFAAELTGAVLLLYGMRKQDSTGAAIGLLGMAIAIAA